MTSLQIRNDPPRCPGHAARSEALGTRSFTWNPNHMDEGRGENPTEGAVAGHPFGRLRKGRCGGEGGTRVQRAKGGTNRVEGPLGSRGSNAFVRGEICRGRNELLRRTKKEKGLTGDVHLCVRATPERISAFQDWNCSCFRSPRESFVCRAPPRLRKLINTLHKRLRHLWTT